MAVVVVAAWVAGVVGAHVRGAQSPPRRASRAARSAPASPGELHDVVSHNVSAMVIQAAAERRDQADDSPAAQTLADIERHGRQHADRAAPVARRAAGRRRRAASSLNRGSVTSTELVEARTPRPASASSSGSRVDPRRSARGCPSRSTGWSRSRSPTCASTRLPRRSRSPCGGCLGVELEVGDPGPARHTRHVPGAGYGLRGMARAGRCPAAARLEAGRERCRVPSSAPGCRSMTIWGGRLTWCAWWSPTTRTWSAPG